MDPFPSQEVNFRESEYWMAPTRDAILESVGLTVVQYRVLTTLNFILASMYDKYYGSMKFTTHLDRISQRKTAPGTNWLNRWTYRLFIINICRD